MHGDGGGRHGLIKNANAPKKFLKNHIIIFIKKMTATIRGGINVILYNREASQHHI